MKDKSIPVSALDYRQSYSTAVWEYPCDQDLPGWTDVMPESFPNFLSDLIRQAPESQVLLFLQIQTNAEREEK